MMARPGGFQTILALEPAKGRAVVALSNSQAQPGPGDIALHILIGLPVAPTPAVPSAPPPRTSHIEITLPAEALDKVVGRYQMDFAGVPGVVAITRDGATLRAQRADVPGAPALPIYPEAPLAFFWKAVDAQIRFTTDASGVVTGAMLSQGGATFTGKARDAIAGRAGLSRACRSTRAARISARAGGSRPRPRSATAARR